MEDALKAFGQEDFDVKVWVNSQVRASEEIAAATGNAKGSSVDDYLSTLVVKLQLLTQSSSKSIDEHSTVCPQLAHSLLILNHPIRSCVFSRENHRSNPRTCTRKALAH